MQTKRKVRADFDTKKEYSVNVLGCTKEKKVEVLQAFFDAGIFWACGGAEYRHLDKVQYTNTSACGQVTSGCMFGTTTEDCNMTAAEFLDIVYEPEQQGHVHAELMLQYAEDAKTHAEPWKLWQFSSVKNTWLKLSSNPAWCSTREYRRKPKTHCVNGVEIPDLRFTPNSGDSYYCPMPHNPVLVQAGSYLQSYAPDMHRSKHGLCYEDSEEGRQAAILHAKAWLGGTL